MKLLTTLVGNNFSYNALINKQLLTAKNDNQEFAHIVNRFDASFATSEASIKGYQRFKTRLQDSIVRALEEAGYEVIPQEKDMEDPNVMFSFKVKL